MRSVAYIRKSKVNPNGHGVSWEVQEAQIREIASRQGDEELEIVSDWGSSGAGADAFSGTSRGGKRKAWRSLLAAIDDGSVSKLYAYSLSRLARSTRELLDLAERCKAAGVVVCLVKEGTLDFSTASGRLYLTVLAAVSTFEADVSAERARDHVAYRRSRGDHIGKAPYGYRVSNGKLEADADESIKVVVDAYREAGTFNGAAKLLNKRGVRSKIARWSDMSVRRVVVRSGAATVKPVVGRPRRRAAVLSGLLRCHCGTLMTPVRQLHTLADGRTTEYTSYICWRSRNEPDHARTRKVSESALLPWIRIEAARLRVPHRTVRATSDPARELDLVGRRQRVIDNYEDGLISRSQRDDKIAAIEADLDRLAVVAAATMNVPTAIDWSWPTEKLNNVLSSLWAKVQLDGDLRPVAAEWHVPEWAANRRSQVVS